MYINTQHADVSNTIANAYSAQQSDVDNTTQLTYDMKPVIINATQPNSLDKIDRNKSKQNQFHSTLNTVLAALVVLDL